MIGWEGWNIRDSLNPYSDAPTSMKTSPLARLSAGQSLSVISSDATSIPSPPMQMNMPCDSPVHRGVRGGEGLANGKTYKKLRPMILGTHVYPREE